MSNNWARIESGTVTEVTATDPTGRFHPSLVWVPCTDGVRVGWAYDGSSFAEPEPEPEPSMPAWENALIAIHAGLASQSPTCPFCQIRFWADSDLTLDARVRDFTQAFLQPPIVREDAVQSGLNRVWSALDATQQTALNTADLEAWNTTHNLGLSLPW